MSKKLVLASATVPAVATDSTATPAAVESPIQPVDSTPAAAESQTIEPINQSAPVDSPPVAPLSGPEVIPVKRGRGRPPGGSKPRQLNPRVPGTVDPAAGPDRYREAATGAVLFTEGVAVGLISDEWKFRDESEKNMLIDATEKYFRSANIPDIPPGFMLIAVMGMYALPRLQMPKTQQKISGIKAKFRPAQNADNP